MSGSRGRALVVDDELYIQELLGATLEEAGYETVTVGSADAALDELAREKCEIAFIDIVMPGKSGTELLDAIKRSYPDVVVIVITAVDAAATAIEMVRKGAYDYIVKPFNLEQVLVAADRAIEKRRLESASREYQHYLEQIAEERGSETRRLFYSMVQVLVRLLELKAPFSTGHPQRVAEMARYVARELKMTEDGARKVYLAALLHDIGVLTATDLLLFRQGPLAPDELREMRDRIAQANEVLRPIIEDDEVLEHIRHRGERYDGTGQPDGLRGRMIPLGARIIAVVEAFDAMTRSRPYRSPLTPEKAIQELERCAGTQFDQQVVTVFAELYEKVFRNLDHSAAWPS